MIDVSVLLTDLPIIYGTDLTIEEQAEWEGFLTHQELAEAQFIRYASEVFWLGNFMTAPEPDGHYVWHRLLGYTSGSSTVFVVHLNSDGNTVTLGKLNGYRST